VSYNLVSNFVSYNLVSNNWLLMKFI